MKKSKFKPTIEESFVVGKMEGERETLEEVMDYLKHGLDATQLKAVVSSRLKILSNRKLNNPFKQKDSR